MKVSNLINSIKNINNDDILSIKNDNSFIYKINSEYIIYPPIFEKLYNFRIKKLINNSYQIIYINEMNDYEINLVRNYDKRTFGMSCLSFDIKNTKSIIDNLNHIKNKLNIHLLPLNKLEQLKARIFKIINNTPINIPIPFMTKTEINFISYYDNIIYNSTKFITYYSNYMNYYNDLLSKYNIPELYYSSTNILSNTITNYYYTNFIHFMEIKYINTFKHIKNKKIYAQIYINDKLVYNIDKKNYNIRKLINKIKNDKEFKNKILNINTTKENIK